MKFPVTEVDFVNDVGTTGQLHDDYPAPLTSPRFDWMRMELMGLLANQSAFGHPMNHRIGTIHYNLNDNAYESSDGTTFLPISSFIKAADSDLANWSQDVENAISWNKLKMIFGGYAIQRSKVIKVPESIQSYVSQSTRITFYKNGKIIEPNGITISSGCPVCLNLSGDSILKTSDKFIVIVS
jgi:hypothetical protein